MGSLNLLFSVFERNILGLQLVILGWLFSVIFCRGPKNDGEGIEQNTCQVNTILAVYFKWLFLVC